MPAMVKNPWAFSCQIPTDIEGSRGDKVKSDAGDQGLAGIRYRQPDDPIRGTNPAAVTKHQSSARGYQIVD